MNSFDFFNFHYVNNSPIFNHLLTDEIKEKIQKDNSNEITNQMTEGIKKDVILRNLYYKYLRTHHNVELQKLRENFLKTQNFSK